jgi:hypothetical protein
LNPRGIVVLAKPEGIQLPATITALPANLPVWQETIAGTSAHAESMGRRLVVETANSGLKGAFTDISEGCFRVFTTPKIAFLLSFTMAGYNLWTAKSFRALKALMEGTRQPQKRARRRRGTYADIPGLVGTEPGSEETIRGPPRT